MTPKLCDYCHQLKHSTTPLFYPEYDGQGITGGPELLLPPLQLMRYNATQGCELCQILTKDANDSCIPARTLQHCVLRLRRSTLSGERSVTAFCGVDDIFVKSFARMPEPWSQ